MYAKSTRPSAKREVQKERSAKRDDRIARPRRAQTCARSELRAMRMCRRSGQIFFVNFTICIVITSTRVVKLIEKIFMSTNKVVVQIKQIARSVSANLLSYSKILKTKNHYSWQSVMKNKQDKRFLDIIIWPYNFM